MGLGVLDSLRNLARSRGEPKISKIFVGTYMVLLNILVHCQPLSLFLVCVSAKSQLMHLHVSEDLIINQDHLQDLGLQKEH